MSKLVVFLLASYAASFVVVNSHLPLWAWVRERLSRKWDILDALFSCNFCSGFWCAALLAPLLDMAEVWTLEHLGMALAGASASYILARLTDVALSAELRLDGGIVEEHEPVDPFPTGGTND